MSTKTLSPEWVAERKRNAVQMDREERAGLEAQANAFFDQHDTLVAACQVLKAERERRGWSVAEAADRCKLTAEQIERIEGRPSDSVMCNDVFVYASLLDHRIVVGVEKAG